MMRLRKAGHPAAWIFAVFMLLTLPRAGALSVASLTCEFLAEPQGIDVLEPRLSWQLVSTARGERQTAYQILAASRAEDLKPGKADLWDSGRVGSEASYLVRYGGKPLVSRQPCFWLVRVWDAKGKPTRWSAAATWSMGLLEPSDWQGDWIGKEGEFKSPVFSGADWIWHAADPAAVPIARRTFRRHFDLPAGRAIKSAMLFLSGDNEFGCAVNGRPAGAGQSYQQLTSMDVKAHLRAGPNVIAAWVRNVGDHPNPAGLIGKLVVEFATGEPLVVPTDAQWRTFATEPANWTAPDFDDTAWKAARVLGPAGCAPWGELVMDASRLLSARYLRHDFEAAKRVRRAVVYYSGLGLSELYLNGQRIGDEVLSPGLTDYDVRVLYVTHDVTKAVRRGGNTVGVVLGNGRFFAPRAGSPMSTLTYGTPRLRLQLEIEYDDGSREVIASGGKWKLTTEGPIIANNEYDGEEYDARKEMPGWNRPGYDDAAWEPAQVVAAPKGRLSAQMMRPIRVTGEIKPIALTEPQPGMFIFDLGQNMVGWCRLKVRGPAGTEVQLRHAELLKPDGTLYLDNIRKARVTDRYTLKGGGAEVYAPRFTYHGFRYVEVTGFPGRPALDSIMGQVVNDDVPTAGEFACSQPMINRIYRNIIWGTRGNYRSIVTDCPQRDERQGWLGDRSASCRGEVFMFDVAALYAKWVTDFADAQKPNGSVSDVNPPYWPLFNDDVTWPASTVIIPAAMFDQYADRGLIERHYPSMVKWIDHMSGFITNGLIARDRYGDWCVPPEDPKLIHSKDPARKTSPEMLATSYFAHCLRLMSRFALLLEQPADAARFGQLADEMKAALNAKHYNHEKGYYDNGSQTSCVLPLAFDLVPPVERERVFAQLVRKITEETKGHIGTGLIGGQWVNRVLTEGGRPDLVYRFATNTTYPSWGYMVEKGATTVWELWNGDTADPAMNSGNHIMLVGDLVIWLYENLAGIKTDPNQPGFKHLLMKPLPVGDLRFVRATHQSPYGVIRSEWQHDQGRFTWELTIPPNTTATVAVPTDDPSAVREGGKALSAVKGLGVGERREGRVVLTVPAGKYRFSAPLRD